MTGRRKPGPLDLAIARARNKIALTKPTTFVALAAKWTKKQIVTEVNETLDPHFNIPLKEGMITDEQAQDYVDLYYQFLLNCIDGNQEANYQAEEKMVSDWYISVTRRFFTEQVYQGPEFEGEV